MVFPISFYMCIHVAMTMNFILFLIFAFWSHSPISPTSTLNPNLWQPICSLYLWVWLSFCLDSTYKLVCTVSVFLLDLFRLAQCPPVYPCCQRSKISFFLMAEYYSSVYVCVDTKISLSIRPSMTQKLSPYLDYCK